MLRPLDWDPLSFSLSQAASSSALTARPDTSAPSSQERNAAVRPQDALPATLEIKTGAQSAADEACEINDAMGFPALLAFAGAALLVGAFIILKHVLDHDRRAHARVRPAARAGLHARPGSAGGRRRGAGHRRHRIRGGAGTGTRLRARARRALRRHRVGYPAWRDGARPRTVAVSLGVGVGVTLLSALVPAVRAPRVRPSARLR